MFKCRVTLCKPLQATLFTNTICHTMLKWCSMVNFQSWKTEIEAFFGNYRSKSYRKIKKHWFDQNLFDLGPWSKVWESNTILDYVERMIKYRIVGWKIKVHADSLITESENKLMKSLHTFYYLHQHVMCGQGIFPAKGKQNKPIELWGIAGMIESAWDEIGPWQKWNKLLLIEEQD